MASSKNKRLSDSSVRQLVVEALSRNDVSDAQVIVNNIVDMHEKAFALSEAVRDSNLPAIRAFLDASCDPFLKHRGQTSLVVAIRKDDVESLETLLCSYLPLTKYLQSLKDERRMLTRVKRAMDEALFEAAAVCAVRCLDFLLRIGANCNTYFYHDDEFLSWCTPLIAACYGPLSPVYRGIDRDDATRTIVQLILHGADVNKTNHLGDSALHWAAGAALVDVVVTLMRNGADINHQNKIGKTALMTLGEMFKENKADDFLKIAEILMKQGAHLELTDLDGWSALHFAIESKSLELVRILLGSGAEPNKCSSVEKSAPAMSCLSLAALHNTTSMVKLLLKWNAFYPSSGISCSPFTFACEWKNLDTAKLLYEAGATDGNILRDIDTVLSQRGLPTQETQGWQELRDLALHPASLMILCRVQIRQRLGRAVVGEKLDLPLPHALQAYLKLEA